MDPAPISVELPRSVSLAEDAGLPRLTVATDAAQGEVFLHGAQVSGWTPSGERPVIWMSRTSAFERSKAIRGGVPICFPWFGPGRGAPLSPAHGFARLADWSLASAVDLDGVVTLTFRLTDADVVDLPGAAAWRHSFELSYAVTFGADLTLVLTVRNTGATEFSFEEALHSYLAVDDIGQVTIDGLAGARYLDKTASGSDPVLQDGLVTVTEETDRVYYSAGPVTVIDPVGGRRIRVAKYGSSNTVIWNPWQTKAATMSDFDDDGWSTTVCAETANALDFAIALRPGAAHAMATRFSVEPAPR